MFKTVCSTNFDQDSLIEYYGHSRIYVKIFSPMFSYQRSKIHEWLNIHQLFQYTSKILSKAL